MSAREGTAMDGIAERLPPGERLLWEGRPDWRAVARRRFHVRWLALYFAGLIVWRGAISAGEPHPLTHFAAGAVWLVILGSAVIGGVFLLAWLIQRTTRYAVTDRRVVMKVGVVLSGVVNIPFRYIASAGVRPFDDGTGTVALTLGGSDRFAYLLLWPHARPWRFTKTEPSLLCVPDAARFGELLRDALLAAPAPAEEPVVRAAPGRGASAAYRPLAAAGEAAR